MFKFKAPAVFIDRIIVGEETLTVKFTPCDIANDYYNVLRSLIKNEKDKKGLNSDEYAKDIIRLMCIVFGEENSKKILGFYDGNYPHMMDVVIPYMCSKVAPVMRQTSKKMRRKLKMKW